jgi:hypothetical protein
VRIRLWDPCAGRESCTAGGMAESRTPGDFDEFLCLPEQPLIVGGQAVNIWADFYSRIDASLDALRPFVIQEPRSRMSEWALEFIINPSDSGKKKSKETELEMD